MQLRALLYENILICYECKVTACQPRPRTKKYPISDFLLRKSDINFAFYLSFIIFQLYFSFYSIKFLVIFKNIIKYLDIFQFI